MAENNDLTVDLELVLKQKFGFSSFRFPQKQIIERVIGGESLLALMPTGAGKSLTYQFYSALCTQTADGIFTEIVLVVSPLIALMQDQTQKALDFGLSATFINSSISAQEKQNRMKHVSNGKYQLLFVTPERFRKEEFWACLKGIKVKLFVVD